MTSVLVVDDDETFRAGLGRMLTRAGYTVDGVGSLPAAKELLESGAVPELMFLDIRMGSQSGLELLEVVTADHPDVAVVMTTAVDDPEVARTAFDIGAYGYLIKPFTSNELLIAATGALRRRELEMATRGRSRDIEHGLARLRSVRGVLSLIEDGSLDDDRSGESLLDRLSRAIALRDEETGRHLERMSRYSAALAEQLGYGPRDCEEVRLAAALHDVGKIGIPDAILQKPGPLTPEEYTVMQRHAVIGYQLLTGSSSPTVALAATIALGHHERWDGSGYPSGLAAHDIPEAARITAIADVFDALSSHRIYRAALAFDEAVSFLVEQRGRYFQPELVDVFLSIRDEIAQIRESFPDEHNPVRIRVLVVDDHEIFAHSLVRALGSHPDLRVVGVAGTVKESIEAALGYEPDVVLMDLELPDGDGAAATRAMKALLPATKVVMLTGRSDRQAAVKALTSGCSGFVPKTDPLDRLVTAVRAAHAGEDPSNANDLSGLLSALGTTSRGLGSDLRPREIEVLGLMANGNTNRVIAGQLNVSLNTVRNHVQSILYKLHVHSKLEAVAVATREGIIAPPQRSLRN